jgi:hypothetical protein
MNQHEKKLWLELRQQEHEKRGAMLHDSREKFTGLAVRVIADEPKHSPAADAVHKASDSMAACRWSLEDIAAKEFGDEFAVKALSPNREAPPGETAADKEPAPDEWMNPDCWWTPERAVGSTAGASRDDLLNAARAGKIVVRAGKHGLLYRARDVIKVADGHF